MRSALPFPSRVESFDATYTLVELEAAETRIDSDYDKLTAEGKLISSIELDIELNAVVVGVAEPSAALEEEFRTRYGPSVRLVREGPGTRLQSSGQDQGQEANGRRRSTKQQMKGGLAIRDDDKPDENAHMCSSGFVGEVTSASGGTQDTILTATALLVI